jgi:hypothetical protein
MVLENFREKISAKKKIKIEIFWSKKFGLKI